jgi:hypothetical protein
MASPLLKTGPATGQGRSELFAWLQEKLAEDRVIVMGANTYRTM